MMQRFGGCRRGATAIEYAFVAGLVSVSCVAGSRVIGAKVAGMLWSVVGGFP